MDNNNRKIEALRLIDGLDVDFGLKTIANMTAAYLRVLGTLVASQRRDKDLLANQLDENDIESFRTSIHGAKSALSNIGAFKVSELAQELEDAAADNDRATIEAKLPAFKESVTTLTESIAKVLDLLGN